MRSTTIVVFCLMLCTGLVIAQEEPAEVDTGPVIDAVDLEAFLDGIIEGRMESFHAPAAAHFHRAVLRQLGAAAGQLQPDRLQVLLIGAEIEGHRLMRVVLSRGTRHVWLNPDEHRER